MLNHPRQGDLTIDLGDEATEGPRHLILTGPNASGKTTILQKIAEDLDHQLAGRDHGGYLLDLVRDRRRELQARLVKSDEVPSLAVEANSSGLGGRDAFEIQLLKAESGRYELCTTWNRFEPYSLEPKSGGRSVSGIYRAGRFVTASIGARRDTSMAPVKGPTSSHYAQVPCTQSLGSQFHQFLVDLNVRARLARTDKPGDADTIERWLAHLEAKLADLFDLPGLKMKFSYDPYKVEFAEPSGLTYGFEHLAAGHASILSILAEILLRIDGSATPFAFDDERLTGVVLIDELEVHLHPSLQERVLPFLTGLFPRLQFVVATHSPAVISSIDNAWVFDLKTRERVSSSDLRGVRYGDLMVDHFGISSDVDLVTTRQLQRLLTLSNEHPRDPNSELELRNLVNELAPLQHPRVLEVQVQLALEARPKASA